MRPCDKSLLVVVVLLIVLQRLKKLYIALRCPPRTPRHPGQKLWVSIMASSGLTELCRLSLTYIVGYPFYFPLDAHGWLLVRLGGSLAGGPDTNYRSGEHQIAVSPAHGRALNPTLLEQMVIAVAPMSSITPLRFHRLSPSRRSRERGERGERRPRLYIRMPGLGLRLPCLFEATD